MKAESTSRFWSPIGVGASLSLLTVGITTLEDFAGKPEAYQRFGFLLSAFAVASAYLMCAFVALWAVAALIGLKLPKWQAALTLAGFVPLCVYTVLMPSVAAYPAPLPWIDQGPTRALIAGCCILGAALLCALRPASVYPLWSKALRVASPAAMLAAALVFGLWPAIYHGGAAACLFAALAIVLFFLSFRPGDLWKTAGAAGFLVLGVAGGAANLKLESTFEPVRRVGGGPPDSPNVILITIDTLRYDVLFGPSDERPQTPALDAFAAQSYVFNKAFSSGPWTPPGIASIATGVGPFTHGVALADSRLPDEIPTIADRMADAGYQIAAVGLNPFVQVTGLVDRFPWAHWHPYRAYGGSFGNRFLTTLVGYYLWNPTSSQLTGWAIDWLSENRNSRFFYWLHYYDPHSPYGPPGEFVKRELEDPRIGPSLDFDDAEQIRRGSPITANGRRWMRHLYDAEVRYVDQNLERLFAELEALDLFDSSLIVLTSDHGEEFFEHDGYEHGQSLYNELIHVPLMIKPPGGTDKRREIDRVVGTAATTATILDLAEVEYDPVDFAYPSLRPLFDGASEAESQPLVSTGVRFFENWYSVIFDDTFKYIRREVSGREELYDLVADPLEQNELEDPDLTARGRELLHQHIEAAESLRERYGVPRKEEEKMNESTRRLLESLGYIQ